MVNDISRKIKEVGFTNTIRGGVKKQYYRMLQKKYHFPDWHLSPYELRAYVQYVAQFINSRKDIQSVIDVGCGTGDLLRRLRCGAKIGYDLDENVLMAARFLDKKKELGFKKGTFSDITEKSTDCVVALGFMHTQNEEYWRGVIGNFIECCEVAYFIVDTLPKSEYVDGYVLDFANIFPYKYREIEKSGSFSLSKKIVHIFARIEGRGAAVELGECDYSGV